MIKNLLRLGLIIPSSNTTAETEFFQMTASLPWITVHASRIPLTEVTPQALRKMVKDIEKAATLLADASVDAICLACTSVSFLGGKEDMVNLKRSIERIAGIPSITTSESAVMALEALGAKRIALVTPYVDELNSLEIQFLQEALPEVEVVGLEAFRLKSNLEIGKLSHEHILQSSRSLVVRTHPDVLFLSCTNMPSIRHLQPLEDEFGISVISSNSASLFGLLRLADQNIRIEGFGRLFRIAQ